MDNEWYGKKYDFVTQSYHLWSAFELIWKCFAIYQYDDKA